MGLDKLGRPNKSDPFSDIGDTTASVESEQLAALNAILGELRIMNNFLALMTNEDNPPIRESLHDTTHLPE